VPEGFTRTDVAPWLLGLTYQGWGTLLLAAALGLILVQAWRWHSDRAVLWAALAMSFAIFMLPTRGRERYLLPALIFVAALAALAPRLRWLYVAITATYALNLYFIFGALYAVPKPPLMFSSLLFVQATSLVNVLLLIYVLVRVLPVLSAVPAGQSTVGPRNGR
jgi:hypothetical protein